VGRAAEASTRWKSVIDKRDVNSVDGVVGVGGQTFVGEERGGDDGLVLDGVERARGVDDAPGGFEHVHRALEDAEL
jgi:hypothetical protein